MEGNSNLLPLMLKWLNGVMNVRQGYAGFC
jgi:hypothetical protein